jgi:hypothetical protein
VIGFYLITRIRLNNYCGRPGAFLFNRFLRIYPQYALAIMLGALMVILLPDAARGLNINFQMPDTAMEWVKQVFIIGLYGCPVQLSPSTWSLNVEVYFYFLIGLLTYRSENGTYIALVVSLIPGALGLFGVLPSPLLVGDGFDGFYGNPFGNAFVFFLGSSAYFISKRVDLPGWLPLGALLMYGVNGYVLPRFISDPIYTNGLLVASCVSCIYNFDKTPCDSYGQRSVSANCKLPRPNGISTISNPLGIKVWIFALIGRNNPLLFLGGFASTFILSSALVFMLDRPVEVIRNKVRRANTINDDKGGLDVGTRSEAKIGWQAS